MYIRTSLAVGVLAATLLAAPVLADNGKSHGNNGNHGKSHSFSHGAKIHSKSNSNWHGTYLDGATHGSLASELKGLNAVHANPNALEHAAPGSRVGRIAAYRDAALHTEYLQAELAKANDILAALPIPARRLVLVDADIAALDPTATDYLADLARLEAERAAIFTYRHAWMDARSAELAASEARTAERTALLTASDGRTLSDAAIAYIRAILNL